MAIYALKVLNSGVKCPFPPHRPRRWDFPSNPNLSPPFPRHFAAQTPQFSMLVSGASTACRALLAQGAAPAAAASLLPAATPALYTAMSKLAAHTSLFSSTTASPADGCSRGLKLPGSAGASSHCPLLLYQQLGSVPRRSFALADTCCCKPCRAFSDFRLSDPVYRLPARPRLQSPRSQRCASPPEATAAHSCHSLAHWPFLPTRTPLRHALRPAEALSNCCVPLAAPPPARQAPSTPSAAKADARPATGTVMMHPGMARDAVLDGPSDTPTPTTAGGKLEGSYL